ncbi:SidA/IucD/PvdA family monooxygenase [Oceanobacillus jeddahense]|uniref:L-lysine N6-monooxygenase MbtG n=1 Tax=Oceanobacillus jeddahense TaxID=1462527 RepID=A0ABY5JVT8_9BACI|nr:SidA/IucD/PvdA family monooxygenase [Oceanobacillus jeddahense]UUI03874.1 SidA/IucD/PvdA family monooxygenase [Oceanobacillus jeddahense]
MNKVYDAVGIGIGPFNLSLAALTNDLQEIDILFLEQEASFDWHPGMLIEGMDLQTPFIADLVTLADPTNRFSYLNYLHEHNRMYQFFFFNRFTIPREEYNTYCKWVSSRLDNCQFGQCVTDVEIVPGKSYYAVTAQSTNDNSEEIFYAKHIILGTGSIPNIPEALQGFPEEDITHTSRYAYLADTLKQGNSITVVGSGQSASEVFYDLLKDQKHNGYDLTWFTRSSGIFQKEDTGLGKEVFSPEYVDYFHNLALEDRMESLKNLSTIRNGVDPNLLEKIYELLYNRSIESTLQQITIQTNTAVNAIERNVNPKKSTYNLDCEQWQKGENFTYPADKVILATGYKPHLPDWLDKFYKEIGWEDEKRFRVTSDYRLVFKDDRENQMYTLTNIEHSHGSSATNLGLSVLRNQKIINSVAGKEIYSTPKQAVFQQFEMKKS